jgi:hypothetical protein
MSDVTGVNSPNPLAALQGAGRSIRVTPASPNAAQTIRQTDAISFSKAAERLRAAQPVYAVPATYGVNGLQATTTAAAKQAIGQMVAARVDTPMDYVSGQTPTRGGALPFYTNPSLANSVATSMSVNRSAARLGVGLDTSG